METVESIATAVAAGSVRASDVWAEHVRRHRERHAGLNALIQPRVAAEQDAALITAGSSGVLAGVPVSVKECFPVRGLVTTLGLASRREAVDAADAEIVVRLAVAGAVVIGKSNVPQAMYLHETDNPVWGRTSHPADPERSPGGSSGGDAALVAAGVVPLAVGNDLAGSLRQPAHSCGLATIVPRTAVLGGGGAVRTMPRLTVVHTRAGFLARRVADLRRGLLAVGVDVAGGREAGEASCRPVALTDLRVGWWEDAGPIPGSPAVVRAVREAVDAVHAAGCETAALDGTIATEAAWLHLAILAADGGRQIRELFGRSRPIPGVARLLRLARVPRWLRRPLAAMAAASGRMIEAQAIAATGPLSPAAFARLLDRRAAFMARCAEQMRQCDVVVCPVSAVPALRHGTAARLMLAAAPCLLANLLDLAAGAVPVTAVRADEEAGRPATRDPLVALAADCDRGSVGLPVGVQVVAAPHRGEGAVLEIMQAIERRC